MATHAVKNFIRNRAFFKFISALETGADHGMWSFQRYRTWLDSRKKWYIPDENPEPPDSESSDTPPAASPLPPITKTIPPERKTESVPPSAAKIGERIEIEPIEGGFEKILKKLE